MMQDSETTLSGTIMVDTRHYTFIQSPRRHNTKSEPPGKRGTLGDDDASARVHP